MLTTQGQSRSPLLRLNLVCLDAPLVAVAWQALFAHAFRIPLVWSERGALFFTAWSIYLADRWFDGRSVAGLTNRSVRQMFCATHQRGWIFALAIAAGGAAFFIVRLDRQSLFAGACLGSLAFFYLFVNAQPNTWRVLPLKETTIGVLFALGVALVPLERGANRRVVEALTLFACLCALNCVCIAVWERELDRAQAKQSIAIRWPAIGKLLAAFCTALAVISALRYGAVFSCIAVSAVLLAALHLSRISRDVRTALADLALLIPAAVWFAALRCSQ